jgi:hypothetical protein
MSFRLRTALLMGGTPLLSLLILGPAGAAAAANGQVCMGVVIDDGGYPGSGSAVVQAADVGSGSTDLQALQAAGDTVYQNNSGLVCAIDDGTGEVPSNGVQNCLASSGSGFDYWSYWEGDPYTNTWTYASIGPAEHNVSSGQTYVEGWRYQDPGPDNATAPKPAVTPSAAFAQACPGIQPVPFGGSGGGRGSGGGGSVGTGGGSSPATPNPSASATPTTAVPGVDPASPKSAPGGGPTNSGSGTTTTSHPGSGANAAHAAAQGASTTTTTAGNGARHQDGKAALAEPSGNGRSGKGGDPALPVVVVATVILLLGGLAWWRWRRRPLEE